MEILREVVAWFRRSRNIRWGSLWSSLKPTQQSSDTTPQQSSGTTPQQSSGHILQLPHELILNISYFLSPASRALLSQTCHPLRGILGDSASAAHLSYAQYLEYLTGLAHDRCDQWVCEVCPALHRTYANDTPFDHSLSCPHGWLQWHNRAYGSMHRIDIYQLNIDHRHVQLALKCTRMRHQSYEPYRKELLRPCKKDYWHFSHHSTAKIRYSVFPKIVTATNDTPRFLIMSVWDFVKRDQDPILTPESLEDLIICPHMSFYGPYHTDTEFSMDIKAAFDYRPSPVVGACSQCRTDFAIKLSANSETAELYVWQDLGPEGSPMDADWNSQVYRHSIYQDRPCGVYCRTEPVTIYHEPDSVRELFYWTAEEEALIKWRARQSPCRTFPS